MGMAIIEIIVVVVLVVFVLRALGAWMLRINEVIANQKLSLKQNDEIIVLLRKQVGELTSEDKARLYEK